jgi:toxin ParE1/3/4
VKVRLELHPAPILHPFALPYLVLEELVVVLAIAHVRRRPGYWLQRARPLQRR